MKKCLYCRAGTVVDFKCTNCGAPEAEMTKDGYAIADEEWCTTGCFIGKNIRLNQVSISGSFPGYPYFIQIETED